MKWTDDKLDVVQNLEFAIVSAWRAHPEMTDYVAERAFEGVDAMCRFRLGRGPGPASANAPGHVPPVTMEKLVDCLRELTRSVQRHTRSGGRQGYLTFIVRYFP